MKPVPALLLLTVLPADDDTFIGHVSLQPVAALSGHVLFVQEVTAEACTWLQRDVIGKEHQEQRQRWNRADFKGELTFLFLFSLVPNQQRVFFN